MVISDKVMLRVDHICKEYPGVKAVSDVSFELHAGEVLAIVGENGAGKSTLIKMISGSVTPNSGKIEVNGKEIKHYTPTEAALAGVGTIYQELNFINSISIAENIFVFGLPTKGKLPLVDFKKLNEESRKVQEIVGLHVPPSTEVSNLSTAEKQLMEVARAITRNASVVIFDEPTSALTDNEVKTLYKTIRLLQDKGVGIIYISHKLDEVFEISDTIMVMRDGQKTASAAKADVDEQWVINHMVGRGVTDMYGLPSDKRVIGEVALRVQGLKNEKVHDVSFELHKGELISLYGLMGSGCTEIARAIYGADKYTSETIEVFGKPVTIHNTRDAVLNGIAYLTNDRKNEGVILPHSIRQNISIVDLKQIVGKFGISKKKEVDITKHWVDVLKIKTPTIEKEVGMLSGGNQQKVALAKFMNCNPRIVIFNEPTRGIDVGTKQEFYKLIYDLLDQGVAVIIVSTEMPEALGMSDRILVVDDGQIVGEFTREEATELKIMNKIYEKEMSRK